MPEILPEVFNFASGPSGVLRLDSIRHKHPFYDTLTRQLALCTQEEVNEALTDPALSHLFYGSPEQIEREARVQVVMRELGRLIPVKRINALVANQPFCEISPYNHLALSGLPITDEGLVPLSEFKVMGSVFSRNGMSFTILPPVKSTNCMYWFMQGICGHGLDQSMHVRLDPLLFAPDAEFPHMMYFMVCYGRHFDWERIKAQKESDRGRWMTDPDDLEASLADASFTDYAWEHRDDEIHFVCEEIPNAKSVALRGSRYFHAIYSKHLDKFIHMDGATRIFSNQEWERRTAIHVADGGKLGKRVKVFRIDEELSPEIVFGLCPSFFVWNLDVGRYFNALLLPSEEV